MATIPFQFTQDGDHAEVLWETIDGSDVGQTYNLHDYNDNTVTVTGTFDSNTLTMQGSNDGSTWFTLTDNNGLSIALTAAGGRLIAEAPKYIRPSLGSGASSDIDVIVQLRRA
jgi:hypothetical protein